MAVADPRFVSDRPTREELERARGNVPHQVPGIHVTQTVYAPPNTPKAKLRQMARHQEMDSWEGGGIKPTGDEALPFHFGPAVAGLTTASIKALPKIPQVVRNIRNPNVTTRGFVKNPSVPSEELLVGHGTTKRFSKLDPTSAVQNPHTVHGGTLSRGIYGSPVYNRKAPTGVFNRYSDPKVVGDPTGTPTTHFYRLRGKPYVHGKVSVKEMEKIEKEILKIREKNPGIGMSDAKKQALLKHGYEVEVFDPLATTTMDEFGKTVPRRFLGAGWVHPSARQMAPQMPLSHTEVVALTPRSIAPRWNPVSRPLPAQHLALPVIGTQQ